ncbi:MAG: T9SS type A sorting domain-containing protein [Bacteroidia bacterium]
MKLKLTLILLSILSLKYSIKGQQLITENFDYIAATPLTANNWLQIGTTSTSPISVTNLGLSYTGYNLSSIGNATKIDTVGQDIYRDLFSNSTSGSLYTSMMLKVNKASNGDYFFAFLPQNSTTSYIGRLYIKAGRTAGYYQIGIGKGAETAVYGNDTFPLNTTSLLVIKYQYNAGALNDSLMVYNFTSGFPTSEPIIPTVTTIGGTTADAAALGRLAFRQGAGASAPRLIVDGLRSATSWSNLNATTNYVAPSVFTVTFNTNSVYSTRISWSKNSNYIDSNFNTLVFVKSINTINIGTPNLSANAYTANTDYFLANSFYQNDGNAKCVYKGDTSSVLVTGLNQNTLYQVSILVVRNIDSLYSLPTNGSTIINTNMTIASFTPSSGSIGTLVTITGSNLNNIDTIKIGGVSAIKISNTANSLVAMVMPGAITGNIYVSNANWNTTSSTNFTKISSIIPSIQQGNKLVGTGNIGSSRQGISLSISADGNTAIVGGYSDNNNEGAAWIYKRIGKNWSQQGSKLLGSGNTGAAQQGVSVCISSDGNTAVVGGYYDSSQVGAFWIFTQNNGLWTQQGNKLVGTGNIGSSWQGVSASISADGNTVIIGGRYDNSLQGAAWVFTRNNGLWSQQGNKLVGTGGIGATGQGSSVSISADGNTAAVGGFLDSSSQGATWVYTRNSGVWTQQGGKLVGTGGVGSSRQGNSVSISADGNTIIIGGSSDNNNLGASWIFTRTNGVWNQQGNKILGTGYEGAARQGSSVSISADGNIAIIGSIADSSNKGALWIFTRIGGTWLQQGNKLVGTGNIGLAGQGRSVGLSADGSTAIVAGSDDNNNLGAAWVYYGTPTIITNGSMNGFATCSGIESAVQSFIVSGSSLSLDSILITSPTGFEISQAIDSGYNTSLKLAPNLGMVNTTTIYVRLSSLTIGASSGNIICYSPNAVSKTISVNGIVNPKPNIGFSINADVQCLKGNNFLLIDTSTISTGTLSRKWNLGNGNNDTSLLSTVNKIYASASNYSIKLLAMSNNGCTDSITKSIIVNSSPSTGFTINNPIQCINGNTFLFTDTSNIATGTISRKWNLDNGISDTSSSAILTKVYNTANTYTIKLLSTSNNGCVDSVTKTIIVNPKPLVGYTINNAIQCLNGNNFLFIDTSSISSGIIARKWNFGLGNNDTSAAPNFNRSYLVPQTYSIKLLNTSNTNCKDSVTKTITVNPNTSVGFTINNSIQCVNGNNFLFSDTSIISSGSYTRKWNLGNGISDTSLLVILNKVYNSVNTYKIKLLTTSNNGCADSATKTIIVNPKPIVGFTINSSSQCINGNNFLFTDTSNISTGSINRFFTLNNTETSTNSFINKSFTTIGIYSIKLLQTSDFGCKDSITKNVEVLVNPIAGSIAGQNSLLLVATPYIYNLNQQLNHTYQWANPINGNIISGQGTNAITVQWLSKGIGLLKVQITNTAGCSDSSMLNVTIGGVGINQVNNIASNINVYPSPAFAELNVNIENINQLPAQLVITDILGKEVMKQTINAKNFNEVLNISQLNNGVYILNISNANGMQTVKFMVSGK